MPTTKTSGRPNRTPVERTWWLVGACLGNVDVVLVICLATRHDRPAHAVIHRLRHWEEQPSGDLAKLIEMVDRRLPPTVTHRDGRRVEQADLVAGTRFVVSAHDIGAVTVEAGYLEPLGRQPPRGLRFDEAVDRVRSRRSANEIDREEPMA